MEGLGGVEDYDVYPTYAESPSVLHYTSGTTGMPKGSSACPLFFDFPVSNGQMGAGSQR